MIKRLIQIIFLVVFVAVGYWLCKRYSQPLLGEAVADQGRKHVQDIASFSYNSNPPTSGDHFVVWAKDGVYDRVISDGHLIHSLEHGYVVVSYDCTKLQATSYNLPVGKAGLQAFRVYAHEGEDEILADQPHEATDGVVLGGGGVVEESTSSGEATGSGRLLTQPGIVPGETMSAFTPENAPAEVVKLPTEFTGDSCKQLVGQVSEFYNKNKTKRLVVVPRVGMETAVALTAWNRVLKLSSWDEKLAATFLSQWENRGPEKTIE